MILSTSKKPAQIKRLQDKNAFVWPSSRTSTAEIEKIKDKLIYISMETVNNNTHKENAISISQNFKICSATQGAANKILDVRNLFHIK